MKSIRVLIVEDSPVVRLLLEHIVSGDPELEVAGSVATGEEAVKAVHELSPDVVSMDIRLPGIDGFEATRRIMSEKPTPVVVISASVEAEDLKITMNALRAGALAVVEKPVGTTSEEYDRLAGRVRTQLKIMSEVRVIRQRSHRPGSVETPAPVPPVMNWLPGSGARDLRLLALGASTGGPQALAQVLGKLPATFPLPVLVVQHMTPSFLEGFAHWLDSVTSLSVSLAKEAERPVPGHVYVAPPDRHLLYQAGILRLDASAPVSGQRPAATMLFRSVARSLGRHGLGVLLTGMGDDGAQGLLELRQAGGYTLAEDASTAIVYGMPAAAAQLGAVEEQLPLPRIGARVNELAGRGIEQP